MNWQKINILICVVLAFGQSIFAQDSVPPVIVESAPVYSNEVTNSAPIWNASDDRLFGLFARSDQDFADFISPISNPVFFEDPRTLTEAHVMFLNQTLPESLGDDNVQVFAMQLRFALTERLSLIATKDGFITSQSPLADDGWADVAAGLKYNLFRDPAGQRLLSIGGVYEMPVGTPRALQGNGDGEFNIFASGGTALWENWHLISTTGFRLPVDTDAENQVWYWSNHLDYQIARSGFYVLGEVNWFHWMSSGTAFAAPVEGVDLINLGSKDVTGNNIVTGAIGLKYKPTQLMEIGLAWETALTNRKGILDDRILVDWNIRY